MLPQMGSRFEAKLASERFYGCMAILEKMILDNQKTPKYKAAIEAHMKDKNGQPLTGEAMNAAWFDILHDIVELLYEKGIFRSVSMFGGHLRV